MSQEIVYNQSFEIKGKDVVNAGSVSVEIKRILKEIGIKPEVIYKVSICCYEAEMNVVMYAKRATLDFSITPEEVIIILKDEGPGIKDIEKAMTEGYSTATDEMREMGFGAGMGLPNIKKNSDEFNIKTEVSKGTELHIKTSLN
jgi:anti-sigma regulatory factor (Ser/Thr protein kinase)